MMAWWRQFLEGAEFFRACLEANAPCVAVENPALMHPAVYSGKLKTDFAHYGSEYRKKVGFWTVDCRRSWQAWFIRLRKHW